MGFFDRLFDTSNNDNQVEERDIYSGSSAFASMFGSTTSISEEKVMRIPTAEACLNLITSSIAQMPIYLYKQNADGSIEKVEDDKRVRLLNDEPNELLNGYNFKKQVVKDYLLHGGAFVSVERLGNKIDELHTLPAKNISITKYVKDGYKISADIELYTPDGLGSGKQVKFKPYELMISLSDTKDGISSTGLLIKGEKIFQQSLDEMEYTYNIFQRGALPLGILKTAARLSQPAIDRLRDAWNNLYSGAKNSAKTVILEEDMDYQPLSMKPEDLQLTESKKGTNSEICKLFGVPESMISTAANKYGSIEQNNLHFLKHTLAPIIGSFEASADKAMLLEREKEEGYFFRFDTSELLRATEKERMEAIGLGLEKGIITINEARHKLDLPGIDDDVFMWNLASVLYNPHTGEMKVPNTGQGGEQSNGDGNDKAAVEELGELSDTSDEESG